MAAARLSLENTVYTTFGQNLTTRSERLRKVTDESGRELAFDHDRDQLVVQLARPAPPDAPFKLRFEIDGDFLVRPGGDSYWELGTRPWLPLPSLAGQFYTFHSVVRVKKPFVPFAPGKTIRRAAEGDENVLETRVDRPICFAVILAGAYEVEEDVRNGVTIRVATYALKNPRAVKQLTNLAGNIIQYYEEFLGPFPMPELNVIEINDFGFGQAPPGTMFITKEAFNPLIEEENQLYSQGINERFAHEIAHQYWGTAVKMPSREEQWLTESFAEYCAALFLRAYRNEATFNGLVRHWRSQATFATSEVPIPLANRAYSADAATRYYIRTGLLYNKGPAVLRALHKELGDETFFTLLKSYQKSFAWKPASTKKLAGLLQYMTKKDYMPFFERYYWGIEMPKD
jgi:aminopeptidase N